MKFISCEGILSLVYGYHFILLNELRFQGELPLEQRLSIPHFLLNSINDMSHKVRQRKYHHLAHHGLIKLIMNDALRRLNLPVSWSSFIDMDREAFIATQTGKTSASSLREREEEEEKEEVEEEAENKEEKEEMEIEAENIE